MKKLLILVLFLVAILLVSCNTETPSESMPSESAENTTSHVHDFLGELKYDENGHYTTCECGEVSRSEHVMEDVEIAKVATCIEDGSKKTKCKDCGYSEIVTIDKLEHKTIKHEEVPATCIEFGVSAYEHCDICNIDIGKEVSPKISHDYKDEFCTMCGSHEPSEYIRFEFHEIYGWTVMLNFGDPVDHRDLTGRYDLPITELYIPSYTDTGEKVKRVYDFRALKQLKKVIIPEEIDIIDGYAFYECSNLEEVVVLGDKSSEIEINSEAFYGCVNLKKLDLPKKCILGGNGVFELCKKLKTLDTLICAESFNGLGSMLFEGCISLEKITFDDSVNRLGGGVFLDCYSLKEVDLGNTKIEHLNFELFKSCSSLETVVLPDTVRGIGRNVFYGCEKLKTVALPKGISSIDDSAFAACTSLENITIPKDINALGGHLFDGCSLLKEIKYEGTIEDWNNIKYMRDMFTDSTISSYMKSVFAGSSVKRIICTDGVIEV